MIAAILSERGAGGMSIDLEDRLAGLQRDTGPRAKALRQLAEGWAREAAKMTRTARPEAPGAKPADTNSPAALLALAGTPKTQNPKTPNLVIYYVFSLVVNQ